MDDDNTSSFEPRAIVPATVGTADTAGIGPSAERRRLSSSPERVSDSPSNWLTYAQAARYCGWSVNYLRNLVCAGAIPVYGKPRRRRFRRDMLDRFLTDPDAAMRLFRAERQSHGS